MAQVQTVAAASGLPEPVIQARDLEKRYKVGSSEILALAGVSLQISAGEFLAIVGPSGSGKTTLLNILGLIEAPSSGQLFLDRRLVSTLPDHRRAELRLRSVGFIFQTFNLLPNLTAEQNVALPMRLAGESSGRRRERSRELLAAVGLAHRLKHSPAELSGGERQRVAIARALANRPRLVLADEPTGNLDGATGAGIMDILRDLNRDGLTIVLVTHDGELSRRAGRILHLRDGRVVS